ncbi:hypothetical protein BT63DRAFT_460747 [Microthyrium microscopicum]|uniref:Concanavalin A-like lectin/glucanase n=1 Tax=Microthyrium microscopicum TaxID=703497 RepID=A0A6A6TUX5_9PEZI|nr:hypothetical protein BT63DRAFT_460747 [Microthyrium microscopicum]
MFLITLFALAGLIEAQVPGLDFGPVFMMQRTTSYLVEYSGVLRVPKVPDSPKGLVVVWPGINTDARPTNLVQTCIGAGSAIKSFCPGGKVAANQWCGFTSTNIGITAQRSGKGVPINENTDLLIAYKYDETTKQFAQTLTIDGKEVSRQSIAVGKGNRFNTAVEVQYGFSGTVLQHTYKNNTFKFAAADPGFPKSIMKAGGTTYSPPASADGGKTWTVDLITIPDSSYGGARSAKGKAGRGS